MIAIEPIEEAGNILAHYNITDADWEQLRPLWRNLSDEQEHLQTIVLWGKAIVERDEARAFACRLEEELARR